MKHNNKMNHNSDKTVGNLSSYCIAYCWGGFLKAFNCALHLIGWQAPAHLAWPPPRAVWEIPLCPLCVNSVPPSRPTSGIILKGQTDMAAGNQEKLWLSRWGLENTTRVVTPGDRPEYTCKELCVRSETNSGRSPSVTSFPALRMSCRQALSDPRGV